MTREEAINKLRQMSLPNETMKILEAIAPELRESEGERIRKELVQFLTDVKNISEAGRHSWHVRKEDAGMCDSFLSYLEKQNPAEWSEEDKDMLKKISYKISQHQGYGDRDIFTPEESEFMANFESLRPQPHWKPSEEQMYALAKAVTLYGGGLDSLYQDLKKLM